MPHLSKDIEDNKVIFYNDKLVIEITVGYFDSSEHKIEKDKNGYDNSIDGFPICGVDGDIEYIDDNENIRRATEIKEIKCMLNGRSLIFEAKHLTGYLSPNLNTAYVAIGNNYTFYIVMFNGDGGYELVWTIENNTIKSAITYRNF